MRIERELPEIFEEFGEQRKTSFLEIKEYKDRGIPVVGMYCAYFPPELAIAAGAVPVALCSFAEETIPAAERFMPQSMCPLVKSSYGFAVEDKCPLFHFADLVIGETTCDGKKKMYEMMAEFKPVHVMELPNSQSERGYEFWRGEVIRAKEFLEEFFHVVITEEMTRSAVHLNNRIRMSLKSLCEVMKLDPVPVLGEDIQKMVLGSKYRFDFQTTPELVAGVREKILKEYGQGKRQERRVRILVTGCPVGGDSLKVIRAVEENGGVVVATENCSGVRALSRMVEEDTDDIYGAIARKYLATGCSIMTPNDNRIELLGEIIDEYHVEGVVEVILRGCHSTGAESFYIRKFVNEEKRLPYIAVDTDYSNADSGQIATRLTAFIEMIQAERSKEKQANMNDCYRIVLSGTNRGCPEQEIFEEIWEYTGIPVAEFDRQGFPSASAGLEFDKQGFPVAAAGVEFGKRGFPDDAVGDSRVAYEDLVKVEKDYPDGQGRIAGYVLPGKTRRPVEQLVDILVQNYRMRKQFSQGENYEQPDYLWVVAECAGDLERIYEAARKDMGFQGRPKRPDDKRMFVSCIRGRDDRNRLIDVCRECMRDRDGHVAVGNGFQDVSEKEENVRLQERVLSLAGKMKDRGNVWLVENYYYELAVDCMSEQMELAPFYPEELEKIGRELYETLYWYLRMKRNVASTAAKMKLHRNTLLPRIARLNEMIEVDEMEGADCERILLVMEVERRKKA
ncbi:MAG: hypothetical protein HFG84_10405 [Dorea sp.]|jgi:benzoyl-CoA reductase/2-hydroxyglutaryl-CoA dehydratase subunit BcrC/BadD/HgdB|nr:hypothetical protein [Dorea sp.]